MSGEQYNSQSVDASLARIEAKIDTLILSKDDHEKRLRVIEAWMLKIIGASGAVSAVVAVIIKFIEK